jgi:hypothetical protein
MYTYVYESIMKIEKCILPSLFSSSLYLDFIFDYIHAMIIRSGAHTRL